MWLALIHTQSDRCQWKSNLGSLSDPVKACRLGSGATAQDCRVVMQSFGFALCC